MIVWISYLSKALIPGFTFGNKLGNLGLCLINMLGVDGLVGYKDIK